jgi:hypothetical protein
MKDFVAAILMIAAAVISVPASFSHAASSPTQVTIHVPSKSLSIMPYYFGKDKGFFAAEQIEPQLVMMAPPTAIAALVAGELDFLQPRGLRLRRSCAVCRCAVFSTFSRIRSMYYWLSPRSNQSKI